MKPVLSALLVVAALVLVMFAPDVICADVDTALIAAIGALGLNLLTGYAGQVSIGNAAFLGIGAYTVVLLQQHLPFPLPVLVAALSAGLVGLLIGLPSLRLRGLYLIFSTLSLQFVCTFAFNQYDTSSGALAGHFIGQPNLFGFQLDSDQRWLVLLTILVIGTAVFIRNLTRSKPGRAYSLIAVNEAAAAVAGVDVVRTKLSAFTASAAIVGAAGAIGAYYLQVVSGDYYSIDLAVSYIAMILIGGLKSIPGSIIGAFVVTLLPDLLQTLSEPSGSGSPNFFNRNLSLIDSAIYGLVILVFLYFRPQGAVSLGRLVRGGAAGRRGRRAGTDLVAAQPPEAEGGRQ